MIVLCVIRLDRCKLPFPAPFLDQLRAGDGTFYSGAMLDIDKPPLAEIAHMLRALALAVLVNAPGGVGRHADIHTAPIMVRHNEWVGVPLHTASIAEMT